MADKSTTIPIGICEDVPVVVANVTILTDFVILDIPEDDNMSIFLGRPFLNTAGAVIDSNRIDAMNLRLFPRKVYRMLITINMKNDIAFVAINNSPCIIQKGSSKNNRHTIVLGNINNNKVH